MNLTDCLFFYLIKVLMFSIPNKLKVTSFISALLDSYITITKIFFIIVFVLNINKIKNSPQNTQIVNKISEQVSLILEDYKIKVSDISLDWMGLLAGIIITSIGLNFAIQIFQSSFLNEWEQTIKNQMNNNITQHEMNMESVIFLNEKAYKIVWGVYSYWHYISNEICNLLTFIFIALLLTKQSWKDFFNTNIIISMIFLFLFFTIKVFSFQNKVNQNKEKIQEIFAYKSTFNELKKFYQNNLDSKVITGVKVFESNLTMPMILILSFTLIKFFMEIQFNIKFNFLDLIFITFYSIKIIVNLAVNFSSSNYNIENYSETEYLRQINGYFFVKLLYQALKYQQQGNRNFIIEKIIFKKDLVEKMEHSFVTVVRNVELELKKNRMVFLCSKDYDAKILTDIINMETLDSINDAFIEFFDNKTGYSKHDISISTLNRVKYFHISTCFKYKKVLDIITNNELSFLEDLLEIKSHYGEEWEIKKNLLIALAHCFTDCDFIFIKKELFTFLSIKQMKKVIEFLLKSDKGIVITCYSINNIIKLLNDIDNKDNILLYYTQGHKWLTKNI